MRKKKAAPASLGDVARTAGVSPATASYVLRNRPGPSKETRERVLRVAKRLRYTPDARISSWMTRMREAKSKDLLSIAWVNTNLDKTAWNSFPFLMPYLQGAKTRAQELGYRIDELWSHEPGMTMRRISRILYQRGIEGVIVTNPARHFRLDWDRLAGISLGVTLLAPRLDRIITDLIFNLLLALKMLKRAGYRRIGLCLEQDVDSFSNHVVNSVACDFHRSIPSAKLIPPLYYRGEGDGEWMITRPLLKKWVRQYRPDAIIGHSNHLVENLMALGHGVPEEIGVVHLATDDDCADWAGIHSNRHEIGSAAVERVISLVQNRQFGVPKTAVNIAIRGRWHSGKTLLIPKVK